MKVKYIMKRLRDLPFTFFWMGVVLAGITLICLLVTWHYLHPFFFILGPLAFLGSVASFILFFQTLKKE